MEFHAGKIYKHRLKGSRLPTETKFCILYSSFILYGLEERIDFIQLKKMQKHTQNTQLPK